MNTHHINFFALNSTAIARPLEIQSLAHPFTFEKVTMTQSRLEAMTAHLKRIPFSVASNAPVLRDYLVPVMNDAAKYSEPSMTPDQIEAETDRLNGLPKAEQITIFCQAMGYDVRDYLMEKSRYMGEIVNDIDYLDLDGGV